MLCSSDMTWGGGARKDSFFWISSSLSDFLELIVGFSTDY